MNAASAPGNAIKGPVRWSLRLLGDFQLTQHPGGDSVTVAGKRERVLLAYLALSPKSREQRRKLTTLLWGEAADETTLDNLRTCVFNLRKALGDTERRIVASEDRDIVLDASAFEVDVLEFRRVAAGAGAVELDEVATLYASGFLDGLSIESEEFESWRREESTRCKRQAVDALTKLMAQMAASGESERAIETGLRVLRLEPLHEAAVRRLMRLYAESGRRAAAVDAYRSLADALKKELGVQPEAETRAVYAEIAQGNEFVRHVDMPPPTTAADMHASTGVTTGHQREGTTEVLPALAGTLQGHDKGRAAARSRWILAGGLAAVAAVAMLLFLLVSPSEGPTSATGPSTVVAATPTSAVALAVLPFANLSTEPDQDFFSDGLTDEITSALAKVPDLRVVARTSAFEFKGQNRNIRTIGEQLGATHLIEGSVRRAGDRVRITVQLIRAADGTHVWSDDYDRQLTDIFAIQEDIARAIAGALQTPLGLAQGESLISNRISTVESYQDYLRAKAIFRGRFQTRYADATGLLEQVVARDPGFAPAWALLADGYDTAAFTDAAALGVSASELRRKAEMAAQRAIQLDPNLPYGYMSLGVVQIRRGKFLLGEELYLKALALDPDHPDALGNYSNLLLGVGRPKEALAASQKLRLLEPFAPELNYYAAFAVWVNGQTDAAVALLNGQPPGSRARVTALMYASEGRYGEAASVLSETPSALSPEMLEATIRLLRTAPAQAPSPQTLPPLEGGLGFVYLHVGATDRVLESYEEAVQRESLLLVGIGGLGVLWHRSYAPVRKIERFKAFARNAGLVDYWRAKGWPDLCRPMGAEDFVCD